jgi:hypothetical protein
MSYWGCQERKCGGTPLDISKRINDIYRFFASFRQRGSSFDLLCGVGQLGIFWWLNRRIKVFTSLALEIRIQTIIFYFLLLFGSSIRSKDKISAAGDHSADQNF